MHLIHSTRSAENAGMDPIDTMAELRVKQNKGAKWTGVDVRNTKVTDMFKQDVLEPLVVKEQIIKSATEAAYVIEDRRCNRRKQIQNASWTTWRWWWRNGSRLRWRNGYGVD